MKTAFNGLALLFANFFQSFQIRPLGLMFGAFQSTLGSGVDLVALKSVSHSNE
jgi:hypothetical protein